MTDEQKEARKRSAENGKIRWIKDNCIRTRDGKDDYVFISYKSDDWEKVLEEIVYDTCKKYGLRVFFDTNFDEEPEIWVKQFQQNMNSPKCKAIIAFIDDKYYSSYATLMEVMASRNKGAGGDYDKADNLMFLPINIGKITSKSSDSNTGLGTERFSDGSEYTAAQKELEAFNTIIKNYQKSHRKDSDEIETIYDYNLKTDVYFEKYEDSPEHGEILLNESQCRALMKIVIPKMSENNGANKSFVEVIHDKLKKIPSIFECKTDNKVDDQRVEKVTSLNELKPESNILNNAPGTVNKDQLKKENNTVNNISSDKISEPEKDEKITTVLKPEKVTKGPLRDKYKNKSASFVAKELFIPLLQSGKVSDDEIKKLQQKEYNKEEFHWSFCAIAPLDNYDKARYYKEKYRIKGVDYMLCHEWTERTKTYLLDWIEKRDVESSEPHTINNDVKTQQLSKEKVHKEENIAKWEDNKIGEIANTILRELIESDKVTGTDVKNLQDKKYSLDTFQSSFPILINANLIPDDMKGRYYSSPIEKDGNRYYLCSQWYGEKVKKHQKEMLIKWIKEHQ